MTADWPPPPARQLWVPSSRGLWRLPELLRSPPSVPPKQSAQVRSVNPTNPTRRRRRSAEGAWPEEGPGRDRRSQDAAGEVASIGCRAGDPASDSMRRARCRSHHHRSWQQFPGRAGAVRCHRQARSLRMDPHRSPVAAPLGPGAAGVPGEPKTPPSTSTNPGSIRSRRVNRSYLPRPMGSAQLPSQPPTAPPAHRRARRNGHNPTRGPHYRWNRTSLV
jgi:hypothetical protein